MLPHYGAKSVFHFIPRFMPHSNACNDLCFWCSVSFRKKMVPVDADVFLKVVFELPRCSYLCMLFNNIHKISVRVMTTTSCNCCTFRLQCVLWTHCQNLATMEGDVLPSTVFWTVLFIKTGFRIAIVQGKHLATNNSHWFIAWAQIDCRFSPPPPNNQCLGIC